MTSREFNRDVSAAKRATKDGPVFVTDRGKTSHVLLGIDEYERITGDIGPSLAELLYSPETADIDFELPPRSYVERGTPIDYEHMFDDDPAEENTAIEAVEALDPNSILAVLTQARRMDNTRKAKTA